MFFIAYSFIIYGKKINLLPIFVNIFREQVFVFMDLFKTD